jgi:hypothetical protein
VDGEEVSRSIADYGKTYVGTNSGTWIGGYAMTCAEGCNYGMHERLDGEIAEVIAVRSAGTPDELADLRAYVQTKYGLTP